MNKAVNHDIFCANAKQFRDSPLTNILARWDDHQDWLDRRLAAGLDPYSKQTSSSIAPECNVSTRDGLSIYGINFASQDYLNLSRHPEVIKAAKDAIDLVGLHSAGSAALMGNTRYSQELELRLSDYLGYRDCTLFPTGWGAGYGVIKSLIRQTDHVVIDRLSHACLVEGAFAATKNVHFFPHLSSKHAHSILKRIRASDPNGGILVVTETLFSMDSDVPIISDLQDLCNQHNATLLVDVAHDLGAIGPNGKGYLEIQGVSGLPDIIMGSFSKTFGSNGGFVASNSPSLKLALRYGCGPLTFTNAISPVQCAIISRCLDIIQSDEGEELRSDLMNAVMYMRDGMIHAGFQVMGQPSAIVPIILGDSATSRLSTHYAFHAGAITNLVEYPAVRKNACRWRVQMMAMHRKHHIDRFIKTASQAYQIAKSKVEKLKLIE